MQDVHKAFSLVFPFTCSFMNHLFMSLPLCTLLCQYVALNLSLGLLALATLTMSMFSRISFHWDPVDHSTIRTNVPHENCQKFDRQLKQGGREGSIRGDILS